MLYALFINFTSKFKVENNERKREIENCVQRLGKSG